MVKLKKIKYLMAGGSFQKPGLEEIDVINCQADLDNWLDHQPEFDLVADLEAEYFSFNQQDLSSFFQSLAVAYQNFDAVVISLDLENVLAISCLTSFLWQNPTKPIIFTTSLLSTNFNWSLIEQNKELKKFGGAGLKANLVNSLQLACFDFQAVGLFCGDRLLRPVQSYREKALALNLFSAPSSGYLARIDFGISLVSANFKQTNERVFTYQEVNFKVISRSADLQKFENQSLMIDCELTFSQLEQLDKTLDNYKYFCLVFAPYYLGVMNFKNLILVNNLTKHSSLAKFTWALAQNYDLTKIKEVFNQELVSEFISY